MALKRVVLCSVISTLLVACGRSQPAPVYFGDTAARPVLRANYTPGNTEHIFDPHTGASIKTYRVRRGDSVSVIAKQNSTSTKAIARANNIKSPYSLKVGQVLQIPVDVYRVRRGDTLHNIASRYRLNWQRVAKANNIKSPYTLEIGDALRIPARNLSRMPVVSKAKTATKPIKKASYIQRKAQDTSNKRRQTQKVASYKAPARSSNKFAWPTRGSVLSGFGSKAKGQRNDGINISAPKGSIIKAAENGVVVYADNKLEGFGNLILIKHDKGWVTAYAHTNRMKVKKGQKVKRGQRIATVGQTGNVDKPQLHFEVRKGKRAVDPLPHMQPQRYAQSR